MVHLDDKATKIGHCLINDPMICRSQAPGNRLVRSANFFLHRVVSQDPPAHGRLMPVITAAGLAEALTPAFLTLVHPGKESPVRGIEIMEPGEHSAAENGDLILGLGTRTIHEAVELVRHARRSSGLVLRHPWALESEVQQICADADLPLLAVAPDATWSAVISLLRSALDSATSTRTAGESADHVYQDLFDMADKISVMLQAPVTIEDAASRVLAYSTGQAGVDEARMSTIVGRQVPRRVRDHFRALGVFRRLATDDSPIFVPASDAGARARFIVPVRAGGEWLGSVWAVMDAPAPEDRADELNAATEIVALYLLRMRARSELDRQVHLDQIRTVLRGESTLRPGWWEPGAWRVAALGGPGHDMAPDARCELWHALVRSQGWRQPLVADVDGTVYAVVHSGGRSVGSWSWLCDLVRSEHRRDRSIMMVGGEVVSAITQLSDSRASADELCALEPAALDVPVSSIENNWAAVVMARAVTALTDRKPVSPLQDLLAADKENPGDLIATLTAVIDHWGEPRRAAQALGIHPNTVRYRMARLTKECPIDLTDPTQRLALRLEIAALAR